MTKSAKSRKFPRMFEPGFIGRIALPNRLVRSATREGKGDPEGRVTDELVEFMGELAAGGVGLIVSGALYVRTDGRAYVGDVGIHDDPAIQGLRKMARRVHEVGGRIAAQINHVGAQVKAGEAGAGRNLIAPSAIADPGYPQIPTELTHAGIREIASSFGAAAFRAKEAEFDAVQLHLAHGYLLSQFLSPHRNLRADAYGGTVAERMRAVVEVYMEVRRAVGEQFPVLVKMNGEDGLEGGLTRSEAIKIAGALASLGVDGIEVSGGLSSSKPSTIFRLNVKSQDDEGYFLSIAHAIRKEVRVPVISVGGFRSPIRIESALANGMADFVALSRPLVREPGLPKRWRAGDTSGATCISCNRCLRASASPKGLYCPVSRSEPEPATV